MKLRLAGLLAVTLLSACRHAGDITSENGGGVYAVRSVCPIAGIPAGTGDVTLFNPRNLGRSRALRLADYDVIVVHYSIFVIWDDYLSTWFR